MNARVAVRVALALALASSGAAAQTERLKRQGALWVPTLSLDPSSMPVIEGTAVPGAGQVNVGLFLEWLDDPVRNRVSGRFLQTFSAQLGFPAHVALGIQIPVVGYQSTFGVEQTSGGLGDVRALLRWAPRSMASTLGPTLDQTRFCGQGECSHNWDVGFALSLAGTAPTANVPFTGHAAPTVRLDATFEVRSFRYGAVFSAGYLTGFDDWPAQDVFFRTPAAMSLPALALRDRLFVSVGVRHPIGALLGALGGIHKAVHILADLGTILTFLTENSIGSPYFTFVASLDGRDPFGAPASMEFGFGSQRRFGSFTVTAGGSWGVGGFFEGNYRVTVGVQWQPPNDEDHDGVGDNADRCLGVPGPAVTHGCPDEYDDPDHDNLRFPADQCPTLAEDRNNLDDDDGCPDADHDHDRVPDVRDACPCTPAGERMARESERRGCPFMGAPVVPDRACLDQADAGAPPASAPPADAGSAPLPVEGRPHSNEAY